MLRLVHFEIYSQEKEEQSDDEDSDSNDEEHSDDYDQEDSEGDDEEEKFSSCDSQDEDEPSNNSQESKNSSYEEREEGVSQSYQSKDNQSISNEADNSQNNQNNSSESLDRIFNNYITFMNRQGTFYLSSIDPKFKYQNYAKITEIYDNDEDFQYYYFDDVSSDFFILTKKSVYRIDFNNLGLLHEPQLNESFNLFVEIKIDSFQTNYLPFNQQNTVFRYSNQKLKFEQELNCSKIFQIKYNLMSDILDFCLEDSLLFYGQYQLNKNKNLIPNIYSLTNTQTHQFITDSILSTQYKKIIHLNIQTGEILNTLQFNTTQMITSFNTNTDQDLLIFGFSDGNILQYNTTNKEHVIYETLKNVEDSFLNEQIFKKKKKWEKVKVPNRYQNDSQQYFL